MIDRDDVTRMARETWGELACAMNEELLDRFANLIASHVAEECAKEAENHLFGDYSGLPSAIRSLYKPTA